MRNSTRNALRGVFGALVVAGLSFGTGQAFALPEMTRDVAGTCLKEEAAACNAYCRETMGLGWAGVCYKNQFGHVSCGCRQLIAP
jgi:hypothetical protein